MESTLFASLIYLGWQPGRGVAQCRDDSVQVAYTAWMFSANVSEAAFARAVDTVAHAVQELLDSLVTNAPPLDREMADAKACAKAAQRYGA